MSYFRAYKQKLDIDGAVAALNRGIYPNYKTVSESDFVQLNLLREACEERIEDARIQLRRSNRLQEIALALEFEAKEKAQEEYQRALRFEAFKAGRNQP